MTVRSGRFVVALLLIAAGAFGLRLAYLEHVTARPETHFYDWLFYRYEARALARGHGFVEPSVYSRQPDSGRPAADHPPLLATLLAPISKLSNDNNTALRLFNCAVGTLSVVLIGLLGREIGGIRTGLTASSIAAVYPNLWVHDALIMSESLTIAVVTGAVLLAHRALRRPSLGAAAGLGVVCGLSALTRSELALLFPLLCVPVVAAGGVRAHLKPLVAATIAALLVVGPWVGYNLARFERPVLISTNFDLNLLGSSCDDVQHGPRIGSLGFCTFSRVPTGADASVVAARERKEAFELIGSNLFRYPVVVAARIGRTWWLFRPLDDLNVGTAEGRPRWVTTLGLLSYYPLLVLAAFAVWLRRRRGLRSWPLLVPPLIVTVAMLVSYGQSRYRVDAEPIIVVLAAQSLVVLGGRLRPTAGPDAGPPASAANPLVIPNPGSSPS